MVALTDKTKRIVEVALANRIAANEVVDAIESDPASVALDGFTSGAGTITAADTILQGIEKLDGNVALSLVASKLVSYDSAASIGSGTTEVLIFTGLEATDTLLAATQVTAGGNATAIISIGALGAGTCTIEWTANPGSGAVIKLLVLKA